MKRLMAFYRQLVSHPVPIIFALLFLAAKVWSNTSYGGSFINGLRSGFVGILIYGLALGLIYFLSARRMGDRLSAQRCPPRRAKHGAVLIIVVYLFIFGSIVDRLQRQGYMPGTPLFSFIPGWAFWHELFDEFPGVHGGKHRAQPAVLCDHPSSSSASSRRQMGRVRPFWRRSETCTPVPGYLHGRLPFHRPDCGTLGFSSVRDPVRGIPGRVLFPRGNAAALHKPHQKPSLGYRYIRVLVRSPARSGFRFSCLPHRTLGFEQRGEHRTVWKLDGIWNLSNGDALAVDADPCPQQRGRLLSHHGRRAHALSILTRMPGVIIKLAMWAISSAGDTTLNQGVQVRIPDGPPSKKSKTAVCGLLRILTLLAVGRKTARNRRILRR